MYNHAQQLQYYKQGFLMVTKIFFAEVFFAWGLLSQSMGIPCGNENYGANNKRLATEAYHPIKTYIT